MLCDLCGRTVSSTTKHHLIPRCRHSTKRNKREFTRDEVHSRLADLCRPCHKCLHVFLTEKELERDYNTIEALLTHPDIQKFVEWIRKRPDGTFVQFPRSSRGRRY